MREKGLVEADERLVYVGWGLVGMDKAENESLCSS